MQLDAGIQGLPNNPQIGLSREYIRKGYRSIHIKHRVICYRVDDKFIDIVRVLHESMITIKQL